MKKVISYSIIMLQFLALSNSLTAQNFKFPKLESSEDCYFGNYELLTEISVVGIKINDIYYDDSTNNAGSFGFEVLFTFNNNFSGNLPEVPNFWQYQVSFSSINENIQPMICTNNFSSIPAYSFISGIVNLDNNNSYNGSAKRLGLEAHTEYYDQSIIELFGFITSELEINLPCMSKSVEVESDSLLSPLSVNIIDFKVENINQHSELFFIIEENPEIEKVAIEKSSNSKNWKNVIEYKYNKLVDQSFSIHYVDYENKNTPSTFYRLKIQTANGIIYSKTISSNSISNGELYYSIYPNPASSSLNVKTDKVVKYSILDVFGNTKEIGEISEGNKMIDLKSFNNGTYYLVLFTDDKSIKVPFSVVK